MLTEPRHLRPGRQPLQRRICPCGGTRWAEEIPVCGQRACLLRWWAVFGWWFVAAPVGLFALGATVWAEPIDCPPGYRPKATGVCVRSAPDTDGGSMGALQIEHVVVVLAFLVLPVTVATLAARRILRSPRRHEKHPSSDEG